MRGWIINKLFHVLGMVQEPWYTWLNALGLRYILLKHPERVTHPGTRFPDKTFYIIQNLSPDVGLAGWYDHVLGAVIYADRRGWIPVVKATPPAQEDDGDWYDFFKGPSDIPVEEALEGANVVFATPRSMVHKRYSRKNICLRHSVCRRVPLSEWAQHFVDERMGKIFSDAPEKMVAIRFRGTDYRSCGGYCPSGHAKVPDVNVFCDRVVSDMERWGVPVGLGEHIFLVTEEEEAFEAIRRRFPRCRFVEKERYANFNFKSILTRQCLPTLTPKENNLMYLLEIYAMARCDFIVGGVNGGVLMALNLNGNRYRHVDVLNTGVN